MNPNVMKLKRRMSNKSYWLLFVFLLVLAQSSFAQDDSASQADTSGAAEIVLGEILIEGVIEKPNVSILPTRMETDFGRIEYINRRFDQELKALPQRASLLTPDFAKLKEIEKGKQSLFKKR